jgi:hypothetical protein
MIWAANNIFTNTRQGCLDGANYFMWWWKPMKILWTTVLYLTDRVFFFFWHFLYGKGSSTWRINYESEYIFMVNYIKFIIPEKHNIHYDVHKSLLLDRIPSQMNPVHILRSVSLISSHLCLGLPSSFPTKIL